MKLFSIFAVAVFSLGMLVVQLPASAAPRAAGTTVVAKKPVNKKAFLQASRKSVLTASRKMRKALTRFTSHKVFSPTSPSVRVRNDGVAPLSSINVPRPVVSESSIF
jgi:hypothetical protein